MKTEHFVCFFFNIIQVNIVDIEASCMKDILSCLRQIISIRYY